MLPFDVSFRHHARGRSAPTKHRPHPPSARPWLLAPLVAAACAPTASAPVAPPAAAPSAVAPSAPAPAGVGAFAPAAVGAAAAPAARPAAAPDSPAVALVQKQLDAYNAHELERFLSFYHPDATLYDQGSGEVKARGVAAMRELYGRMFTKVPTLRAELVARTSLGPWVVDHERLSVAGDPRTEEAIAVYEVLDGSIRRVWFLAPAPPAAKR